MRETSSRQRNRQGEEISTEEDSVRPMTPGVRPSSGNGKDDEEGSSDLRAEDGEGFGAETDIEVDPSLLTPTPTGPPPPPATASNQKAGRQNMLLLRLCLRRPDRTCLATTTKESTSKRSEKLVSLSVPSIRLPVPLPQQFHSFPVTPGPPDDSQFELGDYFIVG
ncbi:hypothetical protein CPC08DRAFT_770901 [Agrocybe pediades]|nr:hypothetical protein CPC08DRAFT_770901 [Agrocybe pediades]